MCILSFIEERRFSLLCVSRPVSVIEGLVVSVIGLVELALSSFSRFGPFLCCLMPRRSCGSCLKRLCDV